MAGVSRGYASWFDEISDISGTVSDGIRTTMDSAFTSVTSMQECNKVSWKSWGVSVLQIVAAAHNLNYMSLIWTAPLRRSVLHTTTCCKRK